MSDQLKAMEVVKILKACRGLGIKELKYQGLELSFRSDAGVQEYWVDDDSDLKRISREEKVEAERQLEIDFDKTEMDVKGELVDELMANDPELYEQLIAQEELISEKTAQ